MNPPPQSCRVAGGLRREHDHMTSLSWQITLPSLFGRVFEREVAKLNLKYFSDPTQRDLGKFVLRVQLTLRIMANQNDSIAVDQFHYALNNVWDVYKFVVNNTGGLGLCWLPKYLVTSVRNYRSHYRYMYNKWLIQCYIDQRGHNLLTHACNTMRHWIWFKWNPSIEIVMCKLSGYGHSAWLALIGAGTLRGSVFKRDRIFFRLKRYPSFEQDAHCPENGEQSGFESHGEWNQNTNHLEIHSVTDLVKRVASD